MSHWPKDNQDALLAFYGHPGSQVSAQLVPVKPPFRMTYEGKPIEHIMFHKKAADALLAALTEIWNACGKDQGKIDALGLSRFDGAYNPRFIRGSTTRWSNHAFGAAIDINAEHNGFNTGHGTMPKLAVDAFKRQGARWGGDYHGRTDPMHFEFCDNGLPDAPAASAPVTQGESPRVETTQPAAPPPAPKVATGAPFNMSSVLTLAASSALARYHWKDRGVAPIGYIKGMAAAFATVYADLKAGDAIAKAMARQNTNDDERDVLSWYNSNFRALKMPNDVAGADTLRHLLVLATGLGMRESSGQYNEGRDMSASNVSADSAEAGLFQTSWGMRAASPFLGDLFHRYDTQANDGLLVVFKEGVRDRTTNNAGTGTGVRFQQLTKAKPLFAVEYAAVGLRVTGGTKGEWGPIRRKEAELRPEADDLYKAVQTIVDETSAVA